MFLQTRYFSLLFRPVSRLLILMSTIFIIGSCTDCVDEVSEINEGMFTLKIDTAYKLKYVYYPQVNKFEPQNQSRIILINAFDSTDAILMFENNLWDTIRVKYDKVITYNNCDKFRLIKINKAITFNTLDSFRVISDDIYIYKP